MKRLLRTALMAALLPGFFLTVSAAPPAKKDQPGPPAKPSAKPPAKPAAKPATPPSALPEKAEEKSEVLLFRSFSSQEELAAKLPKTLVNPRLLAHLSALYGAYKEALTGVALSPDETQLFLVAKDGSRHLYDDGRTKPGEQLLDAADLEDMFFYNYPLTNPTDRLPVDFDPGRARPELFFKTLYGASPAEVQKNLTTVRVGGASVKFNRLHGAAAALEQVAKDLDAVVKAKPELKLWITNLGGTFNWRKIEGTERLSTHSYGIAIDLNVDKSKYWRWEKPATLATFSRKEFPAEIIEAFEKRGFVWGGKWYHYDTMHFEYRPEILHVAPHAAADAPRATPVAEPVAPVASVRHALLIDAATAAAGKPRSCAGLKASLEKCGFSVNLLTGGDLGACMEAIERLAAETVATEALLFHFSGDALHHQGDAWLVPSGAKIGKPDDVHAEAISLKRIVETLGKAKTAARMVFVDTPPPAAGGAAEDAGAPQYRAPGFFFGFAGSPSAAGPRAWQPDLFTKSLAARVASPRMSVSDMFTFVIQDVEKESGGAQHPQSASTLPEIFRFAEAESAAPGPAKGDKPAPAPGPPKKTGE